MSQFECTKKSLLASLGWFSLSVEEASDGSCQTHGDGAVTQDEVAMKYCIYEEILLSA